MSDIQILNFPKCPKCEKGELIPIGKIDHHYQSCRNNYAPYTSWEEHVSSTPNPFSKWKCTNCEHTLE